MRSLKQVHRARQRRLGRMPLNARGAVQIEFILSFLTIMFVIFGMWELIMIVHSMNVLSDAAKEGVRYAIVHGSYNASGGQSGPGNTAPVVQAVKDYAKLTLHDISAISVLVTYRNGTNNTGDPVRVEVYYDFVPYTALNIKPRISTAAEGKIVF